MKTIMLGSRLKKPVLACGADTKGAFALAVGDRAYLYEGFQDLIELDNYARYEKSVEESIRRHGISPEVIACDIHPAYFSARFAEYYASGRKRRQLCRVQHHEAHAAGALAGNSVRGSVVSVAFDGTGFGTDGNIWGGEFFIGSAKRIKRYAHLKYVPMPGGEMAVKEPWRMALSYLWGAYGDGITALKIDFVKRVMMRDRARFDIIRKMIEKKIYSPLTSGMGRLFDAAASLILDREEAPFEAALPVELEEMADPGCDGRYGFSVKKTGGIRIIDPSDIMRGIVSDLASGVEKEVISAKFHNSVAMMIESVSLGARRSFGTDEVAFSGGVFENRFLRERAGRRLAGKGFKVRANSRVPVNDSGIPIGQIVIAGTRGICA